LLDAPFLPSVTRWIGKSAAHRKLSDAAYRFSKLIGRPKTVAVACWSDRDWPSVSGEAPDGPYATLGFYSPRLPHWLHLSPTTCRRLQSLLTSRPLYPNKYTSSALETLTHEMIHALGVSDEARTTCYAMQTSMFMANTLGLPGSYGARLARLTLKNYPLHPPRYINKQRCREGGAWDLWPDRPSPPWNAF
jgi:hypothetical protein